MRFRLFVLMFMVVSTCLAAEESPLVMADFHCKAGDYEFLEMGSAPNHGRTADGLLKITTKTSKWGVGGPIELDLSKWEHYTPVLVIKVGAENKAKRIRLFLQDDQKTRREYFFVLPPADNMFHSVFPVNAEPIADPIPPTENKAVFNPARINHWQIQGDWTNNPVDVQVQRVETAAPTAEMIKTREAVAEKARKDAEQKAREVAEQQARVKAMLTEGVPADPQGPQIVHVCSVDRNILALEIKAGELVLHGQQPYQSQQGDQIDRDKKTVLAWREGRIVDEPKNFTLKRKLDGKSLSIGAVTQPFNSNQQLLVRDEVVGTPLVEVTVDAPESYRIKSADDPQYQQAVLPLAVHRKTRPLNKADFGSGYEMEHKIYLVMPHPMKEGSRYQVHLLGLNTRVKDIEFQYEPMQVRSEAIHTNQVGYQPDDPFKRAYLSLWLGTGGSHGYENLSEFQLIDTTNKVVYTGPVKLSRTSKDAEKLKEEKNYAKTNVYRLDFHEFVTPGEYRVYVPGIGVSYPFTLSNQNTWDQAFNVSMSGFLHHRSGIELGPPFTDNRRPRSMHPEDVPIFRAGVTRLEGESDAIARGLVAQLGDSLDASKLRKHSSAWGGYMDAGDWDRRSNHLKPTYMLMELFSLFPDYFEKHKLQLPVQEAENTIPDLLDEAIFGLELYRRLQESDGGVGGGVESTSHPRDGQASWQETLLIGAFDPDPVTSVTYAATAAKLALLLQNYNPTQAAQWRESAVRAYQWATANANEQVRVYEARSQQFNAQETLQEVQRTSVWAALELYQLTGEVSYHEYVKANLPEMLKDAGKHHTVLFSYARIPNVQADVELQNRCREAITSLADVALEFQSGNSFALTTYATGLPTMGYVGYWSVPEMTVGPVLPRAYVLTQDVKYLRGAVAAAHYSAGANPMNMTMTTGLGQNWPSGVLHIDSRVSGQKTPSGITVFGQCDPGVSYGFTDWVHNYHIGKIMTPYSRQWPGHEAYVGFYKWPAVNEYTIHQTIGPTSYYYGFLAARKSLETQ